MADANADLHVCADILSAISTLRRAFLRGHLAVPVVLELADDVQGSRLMHLLYSAQRVAKAPLCDPPQPVFLDDAAVQMKLDLPGIVIVWPAKRRELGDGTVFFE